MESRSPSESRTKNPRFSVVVPVLNESRWLPQTLAAIDAQTFPAKSTELLFIDNGSTDNSVEILSHHPRTCILHEPRRDPYLARNRGIEAAQGDYIVFLDADCPPESNWLTELDTAAKQSSAAILLGSLLYPSSSSFMLKCYEVHYNTKLAWLVRHQRRSNLFGHAGNMAVSRRVFGQIGLFKPMPIVGDTEIIHRLLQADPDSVVQFVSSACVVHAEVNTLAALLGKSYATGRYTQGLAGLKAYQPVSIRDKIRIAVLTMIAMPRRFLTIPAFITVVLCGWICYLAGRFSVVIMAAVKRMPRGSEPERP